MESTERTFLTLINRPEIAPLLRENHDSADEGAQELLVLELYRRGAISGGKAAELLGWDRFDFIRHASRLGIPLFRMSDEEWQEESALIDEISAETPEKVAA